MSSNKKIKEALIRRYGNKCFIERLKLRNTKNKKYRGCKQYKQMKMLTYHHIVMKKDGGRATIENGALLSNENHQWFHKQPKEAQDIMNKMFQELKREIDSEELKVEYVDEVDCPLNINCIEIWEENNRLRTNALASIKLSKMTKKQYEAKQKKEERREMQRIRKEYEDR